MERTLVTLHPCKICGGYPSTFQDKRVYFACRETDMCRLAEEVMIERMNNIITNKKETWNPIEEWNDANEEVD